MRCLARCLFIAGYLKPLVKIHFLVRDPLITNYRVWILGSLAFEALVVGLLLANTDSFA